VRIWRHHEARHHGEQVTTAHSVVTKFPNGCVAIGDILVMNADRTGATQLTEDPADDLRPTWSPSGTKIAFRSLRVPNGEIYRMKADASKEEPFTFDSAQDAYPDRQPLAAEFDD
jgi:hypothetical protein